MLNPLYIAGGWNGSQQGVEIFNKILCASKIIMFPIPFSLSAEKKTQERNYPGALLCVVHASICQELGELR